MKRTLLCCIALLVAVSACEQDPTSALVNDSAVTPAERSEFAAAASAGKAGAGVTDQVAYDRIAAFVDDTNARFEAAGSELRLEYPWLFTVGQGTDPFGRLRIGARWTRPDLTYILDESDYTADLAPGVVEATLVQAYESWNNVRRTNIQAGRIADGGGNFDVLDGFYHPVTGACLTIFDLTSPNLLSVGQDGIEIEPAADIVVGGWVREEYFTQCLGNPNILGVTWTLTGGDSNGDNYADLVYVEQFYSPIFAWTTDAAVFLDFNAPTDLESVAVHENGHALGLGHFGGPVQNQKLQLKPNGKIFSPEAVMNGGYFGGEKRDLKPTDVAGLTTMYTGLGF